jgi:hypothetical protein
MKKSILRKAFRIAFMLGWLMIQTSQWSLAGENEGRKKSETAEPAYCNVDEFSKLEISLHQKVPELIQQLEHGLTNAHAFHLGKVTLLGVGVGKSNATVLKQISSSFKSSTRPEGEFCTWYFNQPEKTASDQQKHALKSEFHWNRIKKNPRFKKYNAEELAEEFGETFKNVVSQEAFWSCLEKENYMALGCNGMAHRGPSVFGMLLALSGCSSEHSLIIVNRVWGRNGVPDSKRLAIIQVAEKYRIKHKKASKRLRQAFSPETGR